MYGIDDVHNSLNNYANNVGAEIAHYRDETVKLKVEKSYLNQKIAELLAALEEILEAWEGYEMLAALDADVWKRAKQALEKARNE